MNQISRRQFLISATLSAWSGVMLAACGSLPTASVAEARSAKQRAAPQAPSNDIQALVAAHSAFALDLYGRLRSKPGNMFFSPYSIAQVLTMALAGARGQTAAQMTGALHQSLPEAQLHPAANALDRTLIGRSSEEDAFELSIANALWGQQGYSFRPEFLDLLAESYGAGIQLLDFSGAPEPSRATINTTISEQTKGMITELIPQGAITDLTRLVLTNAVYFNAKWAAPFKQEQTGNRPFTLEDGSTANVPTMTQEALHPYAEGDGYQAISLAYRGGMSLLLVLPARGQMGAFEDGLDAERLAAISASLMPQLVSLALPKFDYRSETLSLKEPLQALGMADPFEGGVADFSGMDGTRELYVQSVSHKAAVRLDELGTEAAAASSAQMGATSANMNQPIPVIVDRPFVVAIRDDATGAILFLGRISDPRSA